MDTEWSIIKIETRGKQTTSSLGSLSIKSKKCFLGSFSSILHTWLFCTMQSFWVVQVFSIKLQIGTVPFVYCHSAIKWIWIFNSLFFYNIFLLDWPEIDSLLIIFYFLEWISQNKVFLFSKPCSSYRNLKFHVSFWIE